MTRRQRTQLLVLLLIVALLLVLVGYFVSNPAQGQKVLADLGLVPPPEEGYRLVGYLEAETTAIASPLGGRVEALMVDEGDAVTQGQTLAQLDTALLQAQLAAAQAQRDAAEATVRVLEEGPRPEDLAVAQATLHLAQVQVEAAQAALDAAEALPETDPTRAQRIADAEAALAQAQADLRAAQAQYDALVAGASEAQLAQARAALAQAEAEVQRLAAQLAAQRLIAPHGGRVLATLLHPGEVALPGQPVLTLADPTRLKLVVYVPEADLGRVRLGETVRVEAEALPGETFTGTVVHVADRAEFTPRRVQTPKERVILVYAVEIGVPNPADRLKPGLSAVAIFP